MDKKLGTKELAKALGAKAATVRRFLRAKGKNNSGEYTRYEFSASEVQKLKSEFAKHQEESRSKAKPKAKKSAKANGKAKAKSTKKAAKKASRSTGDAEVVDITSAA